MKPPILTPFQHSAGFGTTHRRTGLQEPVPSPKALRQRRMRERVTTPPKEQPIRASTTKGKFTAPELQPSTRPGAMDAYKLPSIVMGQRVYPKGHQ